MFSGARGTVAHPFSGRDFVRMIFRPLLPVSLVVTSTLSTACYAYLTLLARDMNKGEEKTMTKPKNSTGVELWNNTSPAKFATN